MTRLTMGVLVVAGGGIGLAAEVAPPPRPVDVAGLVRRLGGADFADWEEAARRLAALPVDAPPPELLAATRSGNPEVRDRADRAVKGLRARVVFDKLPRWQRFAERGKIDLFVAATAAWDYPADDPRRWDPPFAVGKQLLAKAGLKSWEESGRRWPTGCPVTVPDCLTYRKLVKPLLVRTDGVHTRPEKDAAGNPIITTPLEAVHAAGVAVPGLHALVVSRGPVSATRVISSSLVLATGDVTSGNAIFGSIIVSDGDVVSKADRVSNSVIIARGDITVAGTAYDSTLIAGGKVAIAKPAEPRPDPGRPGSFNVVKEKEARPLDFVRFFELSAVGVEVAADGGVRVGKVADGFPFAAAGVKVGDVVTAVNGKKPDSPEVLRRLLRDALALGDATVTLRRGDATETVKVSLPD